MFQSNPMTQQSVTKCMCVCSMQRLHSYNPTISYLSEVAICSGIALCLKHVESTGVRPLFALSKVFDHLWDL